MNVRRRTSNAITLGLLLCFGCGDDGGAPSDTDPCEGDAGATYANFGGPFVRTYCAGCHAEEVEGAARQGAPQAVVFDTLDELRARSGKLEEQVVILESMPFGDASKKPSDAERTRFGQWLRCGAPE